MARHKRMWLSARLTSFFDRVRATRNAFAGNPTRDLMLASAASARCTFQGVVERYRSRVAPCPLSGLMIGQHANEIHRKKVARPKRFELLTPRFVVWCSIQLSYGRVLPSEVRLEA